MEGKAALFKRFADIDAWPICLDTQDTDEIVRAVEMIAPGFGGINLEDIAAPRCFEIERRLRESLDIPVFHDDQHGTAIVVLAALTNALRVVGKQLRRRADRGVRRRRGRHRDRHAAARRRGHRRRRRRPRGRALAPTTTRSRPAHRELAEATNPRRVTRRPAGRCSTAPTSSSASARPASSTPSGSATWPPTPVVFALANPDPEVDPAEAEKYAAVVASRPLGLPQPDQQRAGLPRRLPRAARRPRPRGHRRHAAARGRGDRARRQGRRAATRTSSSRRVFHPDVPKAVAAAIRRSARLR